MTLAGPYRTGTADAALLRPPSAAHARSLDETSLAESVALDLGGDVVVPKTTVLHVALSVVVFGPWLAFAALARHIQDLPFVLVPLAISLLFGWVWALSMRGHRASIHLNAGRLDEAERLLGRRTFGVELQLGLAAQRRGDHHRAAEMFRKAVRHVDNTLQLQPVIAQAFAREAIALINLGQVEEASARLLAMPPRSGPYCDRLLLVAWGYLLFATDGVLTPALALDLERAFLPIRGSWGGLALAAFARERLGDSDGAERLLDEERSRPNAHHLAACLPRLAQWMASRRPGGSAQIV
jgi:hypothetical protein